MGARMELLKSLAQKGTSKMVLLVMDGLGGLPSENGQTELERAYTPNIDEIAAQSECGLLEMVDLGITPGSGPGHLGLFGYDPLEFQIGRGILEALGVGAEVKSGEVCARGNFATWTAEGVIADRR
ncbi:MAG: phosphoglycerate mutase, partial [Synergistaceae bacterium]|nr:phosphoglycerate mutase [Synergistaceae bacterium]